MGEGEQREKKEKPWGGVWEEGRAPWRHEYPQSHHTALLPLTLKVGMLQSGL